MPPPHATSFGVEEIREVLSQEDSVENSSSVLGLKIVSCESLSKTENNESEESVQVKFDADIGEKISDSTTPQANPKVNSLLESSSEPAVDVPVNCFPKTDTDRNEPGKEDPKVQLGRGQSKASLEVVSSYKPLVDIFEDIITEDMSDQTESGDDESVLSEVLGRS